jgi:hypothetical protein
MFNGKFLIAERQRQNRQTLDRLYKEYLMRDFTGKTAASLKYRKEFADKTLLLPRIGLSLLLIYSFFNK